MEKYLLRYWLKQTRYCCESKSKWGWVFRLWRVLHYQVGMWADWYEGWTRVTLSLCWVMSCSATAVDFWVMDKVFSEKKLWKMLPWEAPKQICSHRRATCKARVLPHGLMVALQLLPTSVIWNLITSTVCFSHQFSKKQPITIQQWAQQKWKSCISILTEKSTCSCTSQGTIMTIWFIVQLYFQIIGTFQIFFSSRGNPGKYHFPKHKTK